MYQRPGPDGRGGWWEPLDPPEQVFNANKPTANVTPASQTRADAVKAAWLPTLPGQTVPLIWEAPRYAGACDD